MNLTFPRVILVALLLTVASQGALAGTIKAINHTRWAINAFSVDGQSGIDIIGPYQGAVVDAVTVHLRNGDRG